MINNDLTPEEIMDGLEKIKKYLYGEGHSCNERRAVFGAIIYIDSTLPRYTCNHPPTEEDCIKCECGCEKLKVLAQDGREYVFSAQDLDMVLMNPTLFPLWLPMPRAPRCGD